MTAMKRPIRSCGGGADPGPLSSSARPKGASARGCLLYHKVARRAFNSRSTTKESGDAKARGMALFPVFRTSVQMSSDLRYVLASWSNR
ncbi:hypothetical protein THAOC_12104, partial [Thalassiosira oceanica]